MMPSKSKYFERIKESFISDYEDRELTIGQLSKKHKCGKDTIKRYLVKYGVKIRHKRTKRYNKHDMYQQDFRKPKGYDLAFNNMRTS